MEDYVTRGIIWKKSPWKCFFNGIDCHWHFENNGSKKQEKRKDINPYPTAFPYGNGMVLHFYQQQESSTTKTVHRVINKGLKTYV